MWVQTDLIRYLRSLLWSLIHPRTMSISLALNLPMIGSLFGEHRVVGAACLLARSSPKKRSSLSSLWSAFSLATLPSGLG